MNSNENKELYNKIFNGKVTIYDIISDKTNKLVGYIYIYIEYTNANICIK